MFACVCGYFSPADRKQTACVKAGFCADFFFIQTGLNRIASALEGINNATARTRVLLIVDGLTRRGRP